MVQGECEEVSDREGSGQHNPGPAPGSAQGLQVSDREGSGQHNPGPAPGSAQGLQVRNYILEFECFYFSLLGSWY